LHDPSNPILINICLSKHSVKILPIQRQLMNFARTHPPPFFEREIMLGNDWVFGWCDLLYLKKAPDCNYRMIFLNISLTFIPLTFIDQLGLTEFWAFLVDTVVLLYYCSRLDHMNPNCDKPIIFILAST